ncbi:hypothetical protein F5J12DRAFT_782391 [Pisolithus orientalis]|uniref:uncharacterized protein n=1 Tax=Pisolithus orientalis TaxID=936130 RepID=UPI0022241486|nr:uncharacterized protein F5J12DRAFT_782391 [Pisolithus orientalis]KAI6008154.1 hypothetical protein F5J12DRAFT_782391 [Pisolithus orientalis]
MATQLPLLQPLPLAICLLPKKTDAIGAWRKICHAWLSQGLHVGSVAARTAISSEPTAPVQQTGKWQASTRSMTPTTGKTTSSATPSSHRQIRLADIKPSILGGGVTHQRCLVRWTWIQLMNGDEDHSPHVKKDSQECWQSSLAQEQVISAREKKGSKLSAG